MGETTPNPAAMLALETLGTVWDIELPEEFDELHFLLRSLEGLRDSGACENPTGNLARILIAVEARPHPRGKNCGRQVAGRRRAFRRT